MASATSSLHFLFLTPKTLSLLNPSSSKLSLFSLPSSSLNLSLSSSLNPASIKPLESSFSSRFVRSVALSEFGQVEGSFSGDDDDEDDDEAADFSPDLKLFVGNLPFDVDSAALARLFERAGNVEMVEVIYDKISGRSRGFGFVTMSSVKEVEAAAQQFNGYELDGRPLRVNSGPPPPKEESSFRGSREDSSFRGSRGGGGYDGASSFRGSRGGGGYEGSRGGGGYEGSRGGGGYQSSRGGGGYEGSRGGGGYQSSRGGGGYEGSRGGGGYQSSRGGGGYEGSRGGGGGGGRGSADSSNRVYVGNLSWGVDNLALESLFSEQGKVVEAKVVYDRDSGRSRGFGFVTYSSSKEVSSAVESLDGVDLDGRSIRVSPAEERPKY